MRNGRTVETKEWRCRVKYQGQPESGEPQEYDLLVLHATDLFENAKELEVREADILRATGRLSASPVPLGAGVEMP
jgi:hypothetical protein